MGKCPHKVKVSAGRVKPPGGVQGGGGYDPTPCPLTSGVVGTQAGGPPINGTLRHVVGVRRADGWGTLSGRVYRGWG